MPEHKKILHDDILLLLQEYRDGKISKVQDLINLIDMTFKDYMEFHPEELKENIHKTHPDGVGLE